MNRVFRMTLIMTEMCNLACKYCYVKDNPLAISYEVLDAVIERAEEILKNDPRIQLNIDIFGGEPLIELEKVKYFIENSKRLYSKYNRVRVIIFTNAVLLTEDLVKYIKDNDHVKFNFSLDGCKECHDSARVFKDGSGSYDVVRNNINMVADIFGYDRNQVGGKFVISPLNMKYLMQTCREGLNNGANRLSIALQRDDVWSEDDIVEYEKIITELAEFYIKNIDKGLWYDIFSIPILDYKYKSRRYCSSGDSHYAVAPNGDLYPCQRFYNNRSGYRIGTIFTGIDENLHSSILFKHFTVENNIIDCKKCDTFDNFNCLGQCIAAAYESKGTIFRCIPSVCKILKINYKISKYVESKLSGNPNYERTLDPSNYGG